MAVKPYCVPQGCCQNTINGNGAVNFAILRAPAAPSLPCCRPRKFKAMTSSCKAFLCQRWTLSTASRLQDWARLIAMSQTQGSCCTRPGDVPEVWGISQWVWVCGVPSAWPVAIYCYPPGSYQPQSFCSAGTWVPPTDTRALPVLGQIFAVALLLGGTQAASSTSRLESKPTRLSCRNIRLCFLPSAYLGMSIPICQFLD